MSIFGYRVTTYDYWDNFIMIISVVVGVFDLGVAIPSTISLRKGDFDEKWITIMGDSSRLWDYAL